MTKNGILINETNAKKIDEMCEKVQGRACVRCLNYNIICNTIQHIIAHYTCKLGLTKKALNDCEFYVDAYASKLPASYKYTLSALSTVFRFKYHNGKAYLKYVERVQMGQNSNKRVVAFLTEAAKAELVEKASYMWI